MAKWLKENNNDLLWKVILFILSPFFSLLYSLKRVNTKSSYLFFFLFALFFGLGFTTTDGKTDRVSGDAAAYRQMFENDKYNNFEDLTDKFKEVISMKSERDREIFLSFMIFLSSLVSYDYHVFFLLLAVVFSFFMLKSMRFLTSEDAFRRTNICLLILFIFIFQNGIFNINGCRFWTASWIAIYSIFQIFRNGNIKYLLLVAITPLIHQSYWFFIAILLIVLCTKNFNKFWKIIFFISFFISSIAIEFIADLSEYLPRSLQFLIERYTTADAIESLYRTNLYQIIRRVFKFLFNIYINYIMYLFIKNDKEILSNYKTKRIYQFLLVYISFINIVMLIPSLGVRYQIIAFPFIAYIWLVIFESKGLYRKVIYFFPIVSLMFIYERFVGYTLHSVDLSFYYTPTIVQIINFLVP